MLKQKEYKIADTNLALFGTQLEKDVKKAAALSDPEWNAISKAAPEIGLKVWRIEKFTVKKQPKEQLGSFFTGDSYIVLHTYKESDKFLYDIHFWLGAETTQDEAGTAAYKTVELDDSLNQVPIQHREVQDHESPLFLSYFAKQGGIRILAGGIESGFNRVKPTEYKPKLLHIKGRRNVRVTEVPLAWASLNSGDVFVLDTGLKLYQWQGKSCSGPERNKAASVMQALDDERGGKPTKVQITETDRDTDADVAEFSKFLKGSKADIKAADDLDDKWEEGGAVELYRISDAKGSLSVKLECKGVIPKSRLDTNDAFIVDVGNEVFVWIGKKASAGEKKNGLALAQRYLIENKRPAALPLSVVREGSEAEYFFTYLAGEKRPFAKHTAKK